MSESKNLNTDWKGVILAAGKGVRAYPSTKYIPKVLMQVGGKSLIERNIEIMRDQLKIQEIIVVIGYLGDQVVRYFDARPMGVKLVYRKQTEQKGIGHALLQTKQDLLGCAFVVMLGDELYLGSDHFRLLEYKNKDVAGVLTFKREKDPRVVSRNYIGRFDGEKVQQLIEKPENPNTDLMGMGTYLLTDKVFNYLTSTERSNLRNEVEITDALSNMAKTETLVYCTLNLDYTNIATREDCNLANYFIRNVNFDKTTVSLVIPAYNEEATIVQVIEDYRNHPQVDEVLVVDNNSRDKTHELSVKSGAKVIRETKQGYGCALRRGLKSARGDIVVLTEADGSFKAKDLSKLLEYVKDCDMAIGTRTTRQMIEQGANMDSITRWANVFFGKFIEFLWWGQEPRFTDVGCTYRAIWKSSYHDILPYLKDDGPGFSTEMMIAMLICRKRIIEIPVSYYKRLGGESKHSVNHYAKMKTALKMLKVTLKRRLNIFA